MDSPSVNLYLLRHAESTLNATGTHLIGGRSNEVELTREGVEQAKQLGRFLLSKNIQPDFIYSSPAVRTLATAHHSLAEMNIDTHPIIDDNLQELDQGLKVGHNRTDVYTDEVLAAITTLGKDFKLEGGESMNDVGVRMLNAIATIADRHDTTNSTVTGLIYTHGLAIRCLASTVHNWSHKQTYETEIPNASINLFVRSSDQWNAHYVGLNTKQL